MGICKLASMNRAFRGASWADFVWESKLPSNYELLLRKVFDDVPENLGKRQIYERLCRANSFDGGTKRVWLHKRTGGVCLSIASKGLAITGIDDRRYWNHIPTEESRWTIGTPADRGIPLLEFVRILHSCIPSTDLVLGRAFKRFGRRICNSEHVHGWDIKPVQFQLWTSDGIMFRIASGRRCFSGTSGSLFLLKLLP
ncbi:hypothetical protein CMV_020179 [Castanea mollissima]|uniref:Uncharacterized protein n=1 Tax=Castanea mollissima TaxID=60419 RepID=A0A8J4QZE8_9ROSI|nr:hypothetical protein CMV_020179 [Castanea mollissima]